MSAFSNNLRKHNCCLFVCRAAVSLRCNKKALNTKLSEILSRGKEEWKEGNHHSYTFRPKSKSTMIYMPFTFFLFILSVHFWKELLENTLLSSWSLFWLCWHGKFQFSDCWDKVWEIRVIIEAIHFTSPELFPTMTVNENIHNKHMKAWNLVWSENFKHLHSLHSSAFFPQFKTKSNS